jgi:transposase-like protein
MKDLKGVKAKLRELLGGEVILNTDEYTIYEGITEKIEWIKEHRVVNHSRGEWSRGEAHVNGCENRNGFLRTYLRKHRGVSKEYLQCYLDFLSLLLNEKSRWFALLISDYLKA